MNDPALQLGRAVDLAAKTASMYESAAGFGRRMADHLSGSQVKGLEDIARRAQTADEVLAYIDTQTKRHRAWRGHNLGPDLRAALIGDASSLAPLGWSRDSICTALKIADDEQKRQVTLLLYRAFLRQVAMHYLFARRQLAQGARRAASERQGRTQEGNDGVD